MTTKTHKYILPGKNNSQTEETTDTNSVIIIGANGSGKSHLGAWIEKNQPEKVHRIGAQRSLEFREFIPLRSHEQSIRRLMYGQDSPPSNNNHDNRWGNWDGTKYGYTTSLLNDYENVLSALCAKKSLQHDKYIAECKDLDSKEKPHNPVPEMIDDKLLRIWKSVFPQRNIDIADAKITASFQKNEKHISYKGRDMSDGERVTLYLIAQALSVPDDKIVIIDEPEVHLHKSIMNRLWTAIEKERPDCLFIYITHDTQFAANHKKSKKIWVKEYDGSEWVWEEILGSQLPEQLLFEILGNRKPVIFVEGTADSYDTQLYTEVFNNYYIIPCGSCSSVISWTKAMKHTTQLHDLMCYGIIDRDYRTDHEIEKLEKDGIYTLEVAEVENLFLVPEILSLVNNVMGSDDSIIEKIKNYIIEDRFSKEIEGQVCKAVVSEIKYKLTIANISNKNDGVAEESLKSVIENLKYDELRNAHEKEFQDVYSSKDYKKILKIFNEKNLASSIAHHWELNDKGYCDFVLRQFKTERAKKFIDAIATYMPRQIPRS